MLDIEDGCYQGKQQTKKFVAKEKNNLTEYLIHPSKFQAKFKNPVTIIQRS